MRWPRLWKKASVPVLNYEARRTNVVFENMINPNDNAGADLELIQVSSS